MARIRDQSLIQYLNCDLLWVVDSVERLAICLIAGIQFPEGGMIFLVAIVCSDLLWGPPIISVQWVSMAPSLAVKSAGAWSFNFIIPVRVGSKTISCLKMSSKS